MVAAVHAEVLLRARRRDAEGREGRDASAPGGDDGLLPRRGHIFRGEYFVDHDTDRISFTTDCFYGYSIFHAVEHTGKQFANDHDPRDSASAIDHDLHFEIQELVLDRRTEK